MHPTSGTCSTQGLEGRIGRRRSKYKVSHSIALSMCTCDVPFTSSHETEDLLMSYKPIAE